MTLDLADIHQELRAVARRLLENRNTQGEVGKSPPADWHLFASSGWLGLEVPEAMGGAGATFAEVAIIVEEMGRAALASPYLGTVVLGVGALNLLEPNPRSDELFRQVATGELLVAVALPAGDDDVRRVEAPFGIVRSPLGLCLHGQAGFVADAASADRLLLLALDPDLGHVIVETDTQNPGLRVTPRPLLDSTRSLALIRAEGVEVSEASVWRFKCDPDESARRLLDRGALAIACDSLGLSEAMMDATVAYTRVRTQFARPIGSFQAVKHACADMLVQISISRELLATAMHDLVAGESHAEVAVSMAKSYICGAAVDIVGKAMQLHGGFGYTWDSGIHAYLKRAALNRALFGSPRAHRERLAERFLAAPVGTGES
jgi:alkylation response protein AidB-like acyl-CoA dehydrogenase